MNRIFHNPRCSKSRAALRLLTDLGIAVETVRYLETPPTVDELDEICVRLGLDPPAILRTGERVFKEMGLSVDDDRTRREWLELMAENPILIERPIYVTDDGAVVGRPPEKVLELVGATERDEL